MAKVSRTSSGVVRHGDSNRCGSTIIDYWSDGELVQIGTYVIQGDTVASVSQNVLMSFEVILGNFNTFRLGIIQYVNVVWSHMQTIHKLGAQFLTPIQRPTVCEEMSHL